MKCDFCDRTATKMGGSMGGVLACDEHSSRIGHHSAENVAHTVAPAEASDGDRFSCPACGYVAEFVVLDDGKPGEWVSVTSPEVP